MEAVTQKFNNELVFDPEAEVGNLSFSNYECHGCLDQFCVSVSGHLSWPGWAYRACRSGSKVWSLSVSISAKCKGELYSLKFFQLISIHSTVQSTENYDPCDADEEDKSMLAGNGVYKIFFKLRFSNMCKTFGWVWVRIRILIDTDQHQTSAYPQHWLKHSFSRSIKITVLYSVFH